MLQDQRNTQIRENVCERRDENKRERRYSVTRILPVKRKMSVDSKLFEKEKLCNIKRSTSAELKTGETKNLFSERRCSVTKVFQINQTNKIGDVRKENVNIKIEIEKAKNEILKRKKSIDFLNPRFEEKNIMKKNDVIDYQTSKKDTSDKTLKREIEINNFKKNEEIRRFSTIKNQNNIHEQNDDKLSMRLKTYESQDTENNKKQIIREIKLDQVDFVIDSRKQITLNKEDIKADDVKIVENEISILTKDIVQDKHAKESTEQIKDDIIPDKTVLTIEPSIDEYLTNKDQIKQEPISFQSDVLIETVKIIDSLDQQEKEMPVVEEIKLDQVELSLMNKNSYINSENVKKENQKCIITEDKFIKETLDQVKENELEKVYILQENEDIKKNYQTESRKLKIQKVILNSKQNIQYFFSACSFRKK